MTKETNVFVKVNLDGTGVAENSTGIPFLDHMLDVSLLICLQISVFRAWTKSSFHFPNGKVFHLREI